MYQVELNTLVSSIRNHMYVSMYKCMYVCVGTRVYVLIFMFDGVFFFACQLGTVKCLILKLLVKAMERCVDV